MAFLLKRAYLANRIGETKMKLYQHQKKDQTKMNKETCICGIFELSLKTWQNNIPPLPSPGSHAQVHCFGGLSKILVFLGILTQIEARVTLLFSIPTNLFQKSSSFCWNLMTNFRHEKCSVGGRGCWFDKSDNGKPTGKHIPIPLGPTSRAGQKNSRNQF